MKSQGVSFRHAVELLRADFFPLTASSSRIVKQNTVPILGSPVSIEMSDRELMLRVTDYYHDTLKASPEALGYLERRGIRFGNLVQIRDIWAEVGGSAEMEFGDGYCLPIGYDEPADQAIEPKHDRDASLRRLAFDDTDYIEPHEFLERLRNGQSVFR